MSAKLGEWTEEDRIGTGEGLRTWGMLVQRSFWFRGGCVSGSEGC